MSEVAAADAERDVAATVKTKVPYPLGTLRHIHKSPYDVRE